MNDLELYRAKQRAWAPWNVRYQKDVDRFLLMLEKVREEGADVEVTKIRPTETRRHWERGTHVNLTISFDTEYGQHLAVRAWVSNQKLRLELRKHNCHVVDENGEHVEWHDKAWGLMDVWDKEDLKIVCYPSVKSAAKT